MKSNVVKESRIFGSEGLVTAALRDLFPLPSYALLPGVGDATGFGKVRTADALIMSCWPSRGLDLIGVEVKVSRSDWLRELKDPAKAESVCRYCDRWYIAAGEAGIVRDGEIPPTWGLIEPKGDKLAISVQAPELSPEPMKKSFLASILRTAAVVERSRWNADIEAARSKGFKEGRESVTSNDQSESEQLRSEVERLRLVISSFEAASGVRIDHWGDKRRLGEAVRFVIHGGLKVVPQSIELAEREALSILDSVKRYREAVASETRENSP